jgi:hypothetical protein
MSEAFRTNFSNKSYTTLGSTMKRGDEIRTEVGMRSGGKNDAALATRLGMCRGQRDSNSVCRGDDEIGSGFARGDGDGRISPVDGDGYTGIFRDG